MTITKGGVTFRAGSVAHAAAMTWQYGNSYRNSVEIVEALGLDPDMLLTDLQNAIRDWQSGDHGDLVRRLRFLVSLNDPDHGGPYGGSAADQCMRAMSDAADALDQHDIQR
jgi:hypothetical protein